MRGAPWLGHLYFDTVPDYLQVQKQGFTDWYTQEQMNKMLTKTFEERSSKFWILSSLMLVSFLGLVDYATGNEFSFSLFYLIPIASTTWHVKFKTGLFIAALSAITWAVADFFAGADYRQPIIYFWNTLIRLGFFVTVTYLIAELHKSQRTIEALADTDYVTGVMNARRFNRLLEHELNRSRRYKRPFTLVYLDLDNFKQVNDNFGHNEGDQLIKFIAEELKCQIRSTDAVARLGGDEFALLFPEAGRNEVEVIMSKIQNHLKEKLCRSYPFVTFSAGAVTFESAPHSTVETIRIADELMYSVKASTKNGIRYFLYLG